MHFENEWQYIEMEPCASITLEFYDYNDYGIRLSLNNYVDLFAIWWFDISEKPNNIDLRFKISIFGFSLVF